MEQMLSEAEAAERLNMSLRTLKKLRLEERAGPRYFQRVPGGRVLYRPEWLEEWAEAQARGGGQ